MRVVHERHWIWTIALTAMTCVSSAFAVWFSSMDALAQGATPPAGQQVILRFATTDDFPPFNARDDEGVLVGFNIDLARAICLELDKTCEIEARPWDELFNLLERGDADAIIAAHRINVETLALADFSFAYFRTPGRFALRRAGPQLEIPPEGLDQRKIGVAKGTAHEAFLNQFFRTSRITRFDGPEEARAALKAGDVEAIFDDGIGLVFWINGSLSEACCDLAGGPFLEPMFFGDGIGIAVKKGNREQRVQINRALDRLRRSGRLLEIVQRYFPRVVY